MKKYFLVPQPPATDKYTFLVDDISNKKNWGKTTDIDKIEFNRRLLGEEINIDINVKLLFTEQGSTTVFPLGRFITVLQISKDESKGAMTFLDFDTKATRNELREMIGKQFSDNIINEWLKVYDILVLEFKPEDDCVRIEKPDESDLS